MRYIYELSPSFINSLNDAAIEDIPADVNEELDKLQREWVPESTIVQTIQYSNRFLSF